jgi:hypothetical protein
VTSRNEDVSAVMGRRHVSWQGSLTSPGRSPVSEHGQPSTRTPLGLFLKIGLCRLTCRSMSADLSVYVG